MRRTTHGGTRQDGPGDEDEGGTRHDTGGLSRRGFAVAAAGALAGSLAAGDTAAAARTAPVRAAGPGPVLGRWPGGDAHEMRGMWLATVDNRDWPSEAGLSPDAQRRELTASLDAAADRRLNTVFFQARPTADALWPSPHEPWSEWLTGEQGRDPGWDPLDFVVREARRRKLEVEAWFNPYRIALHDDPGRLVAGHPAREHPEWAVRYGGQLYYNPGLPEVRRFVQDAMLHAVERYDVAGVHWDDYFYPYPVLGEVFDDGAAYREHRGDFPDLASWRRHNIDTLVREMSARVHRAKPWVRFGVSPFGVWRNEETDPAGSATRAGVQTYDDLYADSRKWVREGWLDYVTPQLYWHLGFPAADYAELTRWWSRTVRGTRARLHIGEGLYKAGDRAQPAPWQDPAELSRHLTHCRDLREVRGHVFFSAKEVAEDRAGAMARVVRDHYERRSAPAGR
ncbi:family 10 glycosylhydrolase [Streptomyces sp. HNM0574]|uniref:glycoside hydrolase family 10 protein n=1 Tax=Streptomyces sp. HNM0574 TaxID=2714954 RepID=UPI00146E0C51|nr:family 10 glycosylhydrolase [Streptomyces sp. HNM0574]NLU66264.1 family 10 glycosylhydrolase [Streptomyces sp. HNM0574]